MEQRGSGPTGHGTWGCGATDNHVLLRRRLHGRQAVCGLALVGWRGSAIRGALGSAPAAGGGGGAAGGASSGGGRQVARGHRFLLLPLPSRTHQPRMLPVRLSRRHPRPSGAGAVGVGGVFFFIPESYSTVLHTVPAAKYHMDSCLQKSAPSTELILHACTRKSPGMGVRVVLVTSTSSLVLLGGLVLLIGRGILADEVPVAVTDVVASCRPTCEPGRR